MYSDDGAFYSRIKSLLQTGKVVEQTKKVMVDATGGFIVEEVDAVETTNQHSVKQQILEAMLERPETLLASEESITEKQITVRTVPVTAPAAALPVEKDLDIRFATKFISAGGKFLYCESLQDAIENLRMIKTELGWEHVFTWENEIKDAYAANNFQRGSVGFTIENSDAAISLCEGLIADEGIIILNPKQASRRRLPCFPKTQVILADVTRLVGSEAEGLGRFYSKHKGELPSFVKLGQCNNGHFYDKQRLILNAEGTEDIYVILVDEVIPPSLRP